MQRKSSNGILLLIINLGFILSVFSFFPVSNVKALTIAYPPNLTIISKQGECYSDSALYFQIGNDGIQTVIVSPVWEVQYLTNWEKYYNITMNLYNVTLDAGESVNYYPTICTNVTLGYGYNIHFVFEARTEASGNVVTQGVGATLYHIVQSPNEGHRLSVRSVDQADKEIKVFTQILYGGNGTTAQGFSTIKSYNGTFYEDILLAGWYRILAIEPTIQDQWDETFYLDKDTSKNMVFELLAFTKMELRVPRASTGSGNITFTLSNNYPILYNVYIHFYLVTESNILLYNSTGIKSKLDKGIYEDTLIIDGFRWYSDTYYFIGEVWVNGRLFINQNQTQELYFPDNPNKFGMNQIPIEYYAMSGLIIVLASLIGIAWFKDEIRVKIAEFKEKQKLKQKVIDQDAK